MSKFGDLLKAARQGEGTEEEQGVAAEPAPDRAESPPEPKAKAGPAKKAQKPKPKRAPRKKADPAPEPPPKRLARSKDPDFAPAMAYIPVALKQDTMRLLIGTGQNYSELVEELLTGWVAGKKG